MTLLYTDLVIHYITNLLYYIMTLLYTDSYSPYNVSVIGHYDFTIY